MRGGENATSGSGWGGGTGGGTGGACPLALATKRLYV